MAKPALPLKTRLAGWWTILVAAIGGPGAFVLIFRSGMGGDSIGGGLALLFLWLLSIPLLVAGMLLVFERKRWAWVASLGGLGLAIFLAGVAALMWAHFEYRTGPYSPEHKQWIQTLVLVSPLILYGTPLLLLFFDLQNFWRATSQGTADRQPGPDRRMMAKPALSRKTRIAGWWTILVAILGVGGTLLLISQTDASEEQAGRFALIHLWFVSFPLLAAGIYLIFKRRRWAWGVSLALLLLAIFLAGVAALVWAHFEYPTGPYSPENKLWIKTLVLISPVIVYLPPLLLLLLDKNDYWKISSD